MTEISIATMSRQREADVNVMENEEKRIATDTNPATCITLSKPGKETSDNFVIGKVTTTIQMQAPVTIMGGVEGFQGRDRG
jgi:hypothetical protein